ncbi:MAG: lipoyl synthase [Candidatus Makaraimicrobium thalassicum]|nr:MAG: lipoyl synthase [Candidatus Omnitrophota bacterium]
MKGTEQLPLSRPDWIRGRVSWDEGFSEVRDLLRRLNLNSVCVEAACPNRGECWEARHVTFMVLGDVCTRDCRFCNVTGGFPAHPDPSEPRNVALAVKELAIRYVVITSVTRDDLKDGGADHFLRTVREIKAGTPEVLVELLIPDLGADPGSLRKTAFSSAEVIGHNIEMPRALYPAIRPKASYERSLDVLNVLNSMKEEGAEILVKSSLMLGLGESEEDIFRTLKDIRDAGVDIVYMGQYLSPSRDHWPVRKYYRPAEFEFLKKKAGEMGFGAVCAGPMVRSSYHAHDSYLKCRQGKQS